MNKLHEKKASTKKHSRGSRESQDKKSHADSAGVLTKNRFSFSQGNPISVDMFGQLAMDKQTRSDAPQPTLKTKLSQPSFHKNKRRLTPEMSRKSSVQNLGAYERAQKVLGNAEAPRKPTKADKHMMQFFGIKESKLMRNSAKESRNLSPGQRSPNTGVSPSPVISPNTIVSHVIQLSKLDMSQPWDLQTNTDMAESMDDMSTFSHSQLVESNMTRETKIIATHRGQSMIDQIQHTPQPRDAVHADFSRRFSKNTVPEKINDFIFSKKPDDKSHETKAKLLNDKLDLKYQRMFKKRFSNITPSQSAGLVEPRLARQPQTGPGKRGVDVSF